QRGLELAPRRLRVGLAPTRHIELGRPEQAPLDAEFPRDAAGDLLGSAVGRGGVENRPAQLDEAGEHVAQRLRILPGHPREARGAAEADDRQALPRARDLAHDRLRPRFRGRARRQPRAGGKAQGRGHRLQALSTRAHVRAPSIDAAPRARWAYPSQSPSAIHANATGTAKDASAASPIPSQPSRPSVCAPTTSPVLYTRVSMKAFAL